MKGDKGEKGEKGEKGDTVTVEVPIQQKSEHSNLISVLDEQMNTQFQQIQTILVSLNEKDHHINELKSVVNTIQQ